MQTYFTPDFFSNNRRALRRASGSDTPIIIAGHGLLQRTADSSYPFQQDSNFWYLTGLHEPDLILVLTESDEFLIVPGRDSVRAAFDGSLDTGDITRRSGVQHLEDERHGWRLVRELLVHHQTVLTTGLGSVYDPHHGLWTNPAAFRLHHRLKRSASGLELKPLDRVFADLRVRKQIPELAALQTAIDITADTIAEVRQQLDSYAHEYELEADITRGFRARGASGHSFTPIVANGRAATVLHNVANNAPLDLAELTVIDIGAEVEHYAADITRTIAGTSRPTQRQRDVHAAVLDTQAYAMSLLKPGTQLRDYEQAVAKRIGEHLKQLGLITTIDNDSVRRYYPHATSHFLGLDVHDVGHYHEPLEPDMVLTCEPGIYIPEEGIGVRIEDDILITKDGNRSLSATCPRELTTVQ